MIVAKEGKSIAKIFQDNGEAYFRKVEAGIVASIADKQNVIVDCGGGVALNPENLELLKKTGIVFYLSASPEEIYKNVKDQTYSPSLHTPNPKNKST